MIHLILTPKGLKQCLRLVQPGDKLYLSADAAYGIADLSGERRRLLQSLLPSASRRAAVLRGPKRPMPSLQLRLMKRLPM